MFSVELAKCGGFHNEQPGYNVRPLAPQAHELQSCRDLLSGDSAPEWFAAHRWEMQRPGVRERQEHIHGLPVLGVDQKSVVRFGLRCSDGGRVDAKGGGVLPQQSQVVGRQRPGFFRTGP